MQLFGKMHHRQDWYNLRDQYKGKYCYHSRCAALWVDVICVPFVPGMIIFVTDICTWNQKWSLFPISHLKSDSWCSLSEIPLNGDSVLKPAVAIFLPTKKMMLRTKSTLTFCKVAGSGCGLLSGVNSYLGNAFGFSTGGLGWGLSGAFL